MDKKSKKETPDQVGGDNQKKLTHFMFQAMCYYLGA